MFTSVSQSRIALILAVLILLAAMAPQAQARPISAATLAAVLNCDGAQDGCNPATNEGALPPDTGAMPSADSDFPYPPSNEGAPLPVIDSTPAPILSSPYPPSNEGAPLSPDGGLTSAPSSFHTNFTDRTAFTTAAGGGLTTISFLEVATGTTLTTQYLAQKVRFTDGNDVTMTEPNFVSDNRGVDGNGGIYLQLTEPGTAIGCDYPGAMTIELWDRVGGTLMFTSSNFGGSGPGFFGGVVADQPFTYVVLRDWTDNLVYIDNLYIKDIPGYSDYTSYSTFNSAVGGGLTAINFTEVPVGTALNTQYLAKKVRFPDNNDVTLSDAGFITDGKGTQGNGPINLQLTEPGIAIGVDFPGAMQLQLWDRQGGTLLYQSSAFGGSGSGFFGGVKTDTPFTFVVIWDWFVPPVYIDNLYIKDLPGFTDYTSYSAFNSAVGGGLTGITFTEVPVSTTLNTQYLAQKVNFIDNNDVTVSDAAFIDGRGAKSELPSGPIDVLLTQPAIAIGISFPGAMQLELYDHQGGTLLYKSSAFGGSGAGFFGGVKTNTPFTYIVIRDWFLPPVYIDNLYIKFSEYTSYSAFNSAVHGGLTTIHFNEVPIGTTLTTQYLYKNALFTDGNDITLSDTGFTTDNVGLNGKGAIGVRLTKPGTAIGAFYPGAMKLELYDHQGGTLVYQSSNFGGSGTGLFAGVDIGPFFTYVVIRDWVDSTMFVDDLYFRLLDKQIFLPSVHK